MLSFYNVKQLSGAEFSAGSRAKPHLFLIRSASSKIIIGTKVQTQHIPYEQKLDVDVHDPHCVKLFHITLKQIKLNKLN